MQSLRPPSKHRLYRPLLPLLGFLLSIYCFTYSGHIESGDTRVFFNAAASLVQFGDLLLDRTASTNQPDPTQPVQFYPLAAAGSEPLQLLLPAPLYWLANQLPGVGLVHTVWFFNIFVTSAIVMVIYVYALTLGYGAAVALLAALSAGLLTILWPYSKTFFREPLAALMILLVALFLERWRSAHYRSWLSLVCAIFALAAAWLTKEAVVFALPALLFIVLPVFRLPHRFLALAAVLFLAGMALFFVALIVSTLLIPSSNLQVIYAQMASLLLRSPEQIATTHLALHAYLLSIGGSIWGTSPVTLLAIPGLFMLCRRRHYRYPLAILLLLLTFALGYAVLRGVHWFGGLSWPPRFLLPVIPFLILGTLPIFDYILNHPRRRVLLVIIMLVCLYSLWVQLSAVSLRWDDYTAALPVESGGLSEWGRGLNDLGFLRWLIIPALWGRVPFDFAWGRAGVPLWPIVCVGAAFLSTYWLRHTLHHPGASAAHSPRRNKWVFVVYPVVLILLIWLGLRAINHDDLYLGSNPSLRNLLPLIESNTQSGDVLLLSDNEYESFFLNHGKQAHPRVISLPDPPGERPSPEVLSVVTSANPDALLVKSSIPLIHNLAKQRSTLWLLADFGPWHPWAVRPAERFMAFHYYPIRELVPDPPDPRLRLIEYSTIHAPDPFAFRGPDVLTDFRFGDSIQLLGVSLPAGLTYHVGDIVALSLYWQTQLSLQQNYTVAWFIVDEAGTVIKQGTDSEPVWGFAPTTTWQPAVPLWDNRALQIPVNIASGAYKVWVRLYQTGASEIRLAVMGTQVQDGTIAVLPFTITIEE